MECQTIQKVFFRLHDTFLNHFSHLNLKSIRCMFLQRTKQATATLMQVSKSTYQMELQGLCSTNLFSRQEVLRAVPSRISKQKQQQVSTACSVGVETRNGHRNEKRSPDRNHETIVLGLFSHKNLKRAIKGQFLDSVQNFDLHSDHHFESHLQQNGLYQSHRMCDQFVTFATVANCRKFEFVTKIFFLIFFSFFSKRDLSYFGHKCHKWLHFQL